MNEQLSKEALSGIITDALSGIDLYSESAVYLLLGTAAHESLMGKYRRQVGGPALGVFQMEPRTHDDIVNNYLKYNKELIHKVLMTSMVKDFNSTQLISNDTYAACMSRIHYLRVPEALPDAGDIDGMARYWKKHYNTYLGAGTEEQFINHYKNYVL